MNCVLGIDGGGTSTVCLLADEEGRILARTETAASNHRKADLGEAREALRAGITAALREAGIKACAPVRLASVCAGLAGVDTESDVQALRQMLGEMVATDHLLVVNDGEIALAGALDGEPGVLVISGTGSIAWAAAEDGGRVRVGGWDYILGDEGSGYDIGARVLRAVAAAHDRRIAPTCLTARTFRAFDVRKFDELLDTIYHRELTPQRVASLALEADEAASSGDAASQRILNETAQELVALACAAARLTKLDRKPFQIVAAGGVLLADGYFAACFRENMCRTMSSARFVAPLHSPVEGAVRLALRALDAHDKLARV